MVHKMSLETERQRLVFFLHQTQSLRRLYGSLTSPKQSCDRLSAKGWVLPPKPLQPTLSINVCATR